MDAQGKQEQQMDNSNELRLNNVLKSFGMIRSEVLEMGTTCSHPLLYILRVFQCETEVIQHLNSINIRSQNCSIKALRDLMMSGY